ncbi:hypothetical protein JW921_08315 [Candidatus Fermentibacterales bacterium]|nr:hypothetical protein [Candidatus Fermentibacterales bacterium]
MACFDNTLYLASQTALFCDMLQYAWADSLEDYIGEMPGAVQVHDIAFDEGDVWAGCDNAANSIIRYDQSGQQVDAIDRSLVPCATGLAIDPEGMLWAADNPNGLIYRIDPAGSALIPGTWPRIKLLAFPGPAS